VGEGLILCAEQSLDAGQLDEALRLYDHVRRASVPPQRILEATRGAILARGSEGVPLLLETLRSPDRDTFDMGLRAARELSGQQTTEALAAELNRTPPDRQSVLLLALADRSDDAVAPAVFNAARGGSKALRLAAIGALERKENSASVPVLLEAATDSDTDVARAAKGVLGRFPGKDLDTAIVARLPQASGEIREVLVELAGQRRVAAALPELFRAAKDTDPELRSASVSALGETVTVDDLGALADLLVAAPSEDDVAELQDALDAACTRLPDKDRCAESLLARLSTSPPPARGALLRVLGTVATPEALTAVRSSLNHSDEGVRDAAFRVLADWPEASALPALMEVLRSTTDDTRRTLALRGAVRLLSAGERPTSQSVTTYEELLSRARRVDDRRLVLSGIGTVADPAALRIIEPLLGENAVRKEAEFALLNIAGNVAGFAPAEARAVAAKLQTDSQDAATRERAAQVLQRIEKLEGFITAWAVAGPYALESGEGGSLFNREFPPEQRDNPVDWRALPVSTQNNRPWMMDLLTVRSGGTHCAAYARTWVHSGKAQPARIEFGTDDGHKLWFNGEQVAQADRGGAAVEGEFRTPVTLREGWNAILLKVVQDTGPWEFCVRLRSPDGGKLEGLRVQPAPPKE
jgi:HEAT repeat protein